jgi:hypothetical protein
MVQSQLETGLIHKKGHKCVTLPQNGALSQAPCCAACRCPLQPQTRCCSTPHACQPPPLLLLLLLPAALPPPTPRLRVRVAVRAVGVRRSPTDRPQRQPIMYVPSAYQLARSNSVCVPAFPIAYARALDVHEIRSGRDMPGCWAALLGAGCTGGTVCVCSDAVALWAVHMPLQQQQQSHTPSFIKHRLLSFPLCKRIVLDDPSLGQPLLYASVTRPATCRCPLQPQTCCCSTPHAYQPSPLLLLLLLPAALANLVLYPLDRALAARHVSAFVRLKLLWFLFRSATAYSSAKR